MTVIKHLWPINEIEAHCDIPCGIYDPISAKIAAQTVLKMVMRIQAAPPIEKEASTNNSVSRYITVKEEHAQLVKQELDILWHDYFRPDHLEKYPDLHTKFWNATKLASKNKQSVDIDAAKQLVDAVDSIAETYWATKGITYNDPVSDTRFGT
jgi:nickel superoxide dismutase